VSQWLLVEGPFAHKCYIDVVKEEHDRMTTERAGPWVVNQDILGCCDTVPGAESNKQECTSSRHMRVWRSTPYHTSADENTSQKARRGCGSMGAVTD
jgi:hypothetical protein